jgi:solute carrier family 10 (sodium/bile acid cotransporter), member 7
VAAAGAHAPTGHSKITPWPSLLSFTHAPHSHDHRARPFFMTEWLRRAKPDPFIVALLLTVLVATFLPASGSVASVLGILSTAAIVVLFFLHGARLPRENVTSALRHWRLHLTILATTFAVFPLLGFALSRAVPGLLPSALWVGVLFLCALPSTVQSSIAFTSIARGNVAGTVTAAAASNLLGVALSPLIAAQLTQSHAAGPSLSGIWKILLQLLLPFVLGHLLRPWLGEWAAKRKTLLSFTDRSTIVLAVYTAFSAAVLAGIWSQMPLQTLLILVVICILLLAVVLTMTRFGARALGFPREDEISIVFCGSKKSLVTGVPMARVMFPAADAGAAILPLMLFHQIQLMVCAWLARRYAAQGVAVEKSSEEVR